MPGIGAGSDVVSDLLMASASSSIQRIADVGGNSVGLRIDKFLAGRHPALSPPRIQPLIAAGAVSARSDPSAAPRTILNASYRVKRGERIALDLPEAAEAHIEAQAIPLKIAYEDAHLIVVDKPAGLVVHPAPGNPDRTLVNALIAHCGSSLRGGGGGEGQGYRHPAT